MITLFSTPKPFAGHIAVIQRNAIRSWQRVHPDAEIILIGDDSGTEETCRELGIRHIAGVKKNAHGTKYLASIYDQAQEAARYDLLCHVNCDILLMGDFCRAVERVRNHPGQFLMAGRRWDVDISRAWDFQNPDWEAKLRQLAVETDRQRPPQWIDYFVFSKGLYYREIPEFVIGRPGWDNWLLWHARARGARVVDASAVVCAVHQNHDYSYHPDGEKGVWEGEEAHENFRLLDGNRKLRTLENATHSLHDGGLRRNYKHWMIQAKRGAQALAGPMWFRMLNASRPLRHKIGLRQKQKA